MNPNITIEQDGNDDYWKWHGSDFENNDNDNENNGTGKDANDNAYTD